jgi:PAS domain S-box-containing protein
LDCVWIASDDEQLTEMVLEMLPRPLGHRVLTGASELPSEPCDLLVVDRSGLMRLQAALRARKESEHPTFFPVLLAEASEGSEGTLADGIDEVVRVPGSQDEMALRIGGLLRTRQLSRALADSEERFRLVARATNDALWDWNVIDDTAWWSDSYYERVGCSRSTVPSFEAWVSLIHPDDRAEVTAGFRAAIERGDETWRNRYRHRMADGSYGYVLDRGYTEFGADGKPVRMVGALMDITESTRVDAARALLVDASERLAASLDYDTAITTVAQLPCPNFADWCVVHLVDDSGIVSRSAAAPSATPPLHPVHPPPDLIASLVRGMRPLVFSRTDECIRSGWIPSEVQAAKAMLVPLVTNSRVVGVMGLVSTSGERRFDDADVALAMQLGHRGAAALENARLYRQAQAAIRARDEFISIAAHEMKTPIATLSGYAQLLQNLSAPPEKLTSILRVVDRQCGRLNRMVQRLLEISRLEMGQFTLHLASWDLATLANGSVERMRLISPRHTLAVEVESPLRVCIDPDRIEEVITNLLENAVKFSPDGGEISVRASCQGTDAVIAVHDGGIGISPERLPRLFERFYRAHSNTTEDYGGLGIGLWVCREIVSRHGGRIWCEQPAARGTVFKFSLPIDKSGEE